MDCTFKTKEGRFNYRVGAIIMSDLGLLVASNAKEPYYYSVGGRVKMHETLDDAIEREVIEETGTKIERKTLGFIHENFFTSDLTGETYHELSFYYYVELKNSTISCHSYNEFDEQEQLQWVPFEELPQADLRPAFLKELTKDKNKTIQHIVQRG
ncbi:hypothetical protein ATZ33_00220 [Enterococcus silesiacus]|uniref:ADP-ribose pyrophosphatase n=1 Tax=Enterococcus silesiacus TaxID=332949 RepID=A0A0S3K6M7_9ENTE|nr:NUDIX domain-containing protein [Enterococcus silesiacus]ALR99860.1 hypothetical protein ATZ33_00220 [Enterococcus silesiacus]OJG92837.1 ADP-ribose pyrophosphatase [Enterococcus silesiacus]